MLVYYAISNTVDTLNHGVESIPVTVSFLGGCNIFLRPQAWLFTPYILRCFGDKTIFRLLTISGFM